MSVHMRVAGAQSGLDIDSIEHEHLRGNKYASRRETSGMTRPATTDSISTHIP